jgi:hypothetical protein
MAQISSRSPKPELDDISKLTAPEEFRRAIVRDPFASSYRFDFDAYRGAPPDPSMLYRGRTEVPLSGYYLDLDGEVVNYYNAGTLFPHLAPGAGTGGRFLFLTDRRTATTSDLRFMALRRGWDGNVRKLIIR